MEIAQMPRIYNCLYVSEATLSFQGDPTIEPIVRTSIAWNESVAITGVLIYSGGFFSQYLEGERDDVDRLIERIRADVRHHSLVVSKTDLINERLFPKWSLAYAGDIGFVKNEITRLFTAAHSGRLGTQAPARMINLMRDFIAVRARFGPTIH
jgi:hypothetical protein